jgi:hypothetical protein
MAKLGFFGLSLVVSTMIILVAVLVLVPLLKTMYPGLIQGFATYDCSRDVTCPEGSFCQSNQCIAIKPPRTGGASDGYFS